MKKLLYLCLCALLVCFTSCEDDIAQPQAPPPAEDGHYLVMLYGVGGGNLDENIVENILQALEVGSPSKVKMTFQYRFSSHYQKLSADRFANFLNVRRFTSDDNVHLKGCFDATDPSKATEAFVINNYDKIRSTSLGGADYVMASDTALTSFINWSKSKYPKATKSILIISDHGSGWDLYSDGLRDFNADAVTRAILSDDNTRDPKTGKKIVMTLGAVKRALSEVGGVDVLYDDACLMSTWENLTGYSEVARYFLGSLETAPGCGGNYHYLINRLDQSDVTDEGMESAFRGYVDDIIDKWWSEDMEKLAEKTIYGDFGLYNLKKIETPLNLIRQITQTLTEKWQSTEPIAGISASAELGDEWKNYIRPAILHCIVANNSIGDIAADSIPKPLRDLLESRHVKKSVDDNITYYNGQEVLYAMKTTDLEKLDQEGAYLEAFKKFWIELQRQTYFDSYCFADFLRLIVNNLREGGLSDSDNPFAQYQKQLYEAVSNMAYIRSTHPLPAATVKELNMIDYSYNCCSPGLFIYSFDKAIYEGSKDFTYRWVNYIPDVEKAFAVYQSCDFDKKTSWSSFLRLADNIPSIVTNPARQQYQN